VLVFAEVLDEQLRAIEVGRDELGVRLQRALELVERLVDLALVPEDLAAAVVGLGAVGVRAQRLVEPGERLLGAPAVGGLHRLIETIPVAIVVLHGAFAGSGGDPQPRFPAAKHSRTRGSEGARSSVGARA